METRLPVNSPPPPRTLVVARESARANVWSDAMGETGCDSMALEPAGAIRLAHAADAALILGDALNPELVNRLRQAAAGRAFAIIAAVGDKAAMPPGVDDRLPERLRPSAATLRVRAAFRMALAEEEAQARRALISPNGFAAPEEEGQPYKALYVGQPGPAYLALQPALAAIAMDLSASLSLPMALDHLHESEIDLVIADGVEAAEDAMRFCLALRRSPRVHHVPGVLLTKPGFERESDAIAKGVTEVLDAQEDPSAMAARLLRLARRKRRQDALHAFFEAPPPASWIDPATGLFTRDILARRLQDLTAISEASRRALSVAILKLDPYPAFNAKRGDLAKSVGGMLQRLVRAQDTGAALDWRTYAILMPGSDLRAAETGGARAAAVLEATGLVDGGGQLMARLGVGAAEYHPGEAAGAFLARAAARALTRDSAA
jgi:PleD family two-component response regulator